NVRLVDGDLLSRPRDLDDEGASVFAVDAAADDLAVVARDRLHLPEVGNRLVWEDDRPHQVAPGEALVHGGQVGSELAPDRPEGVAGGAERLLVRRHTPSRVPLTDVGVVDQLFEE